MPIKDPEKRKAYHKKYIKEHYKKNKEYYLQRNKEATQKVREFILQSKSEPCRDCGKSYPFYVMDFDHVGEKKFNLGGAHKRGIDKIKQEIAKCEVVCSNCHRIRTFIRKHAPVV